ncbi:hypothetical protein N7603_07140 [Acholeplasma vituli]|uniref:Nitrogen regulatory protein P-II n=1 Tax=Paracholeplasma vituli TaxID=69473 RepID=A0ABT2PWU9_9MOLU|nr:hypothetical protein [Paracholeplasma vituli]MCU0105429.1 hypothetical protein [Paracholeplasma vituli]
MQALFIVLNDLSYLDQILSKFLELKVRGATIIDSQGMASAIMNNEGLSMLMSGPFQRSLDTEQKGSKTIFTVIPEVEKVEEVVNEVRKIVEKSKKQVIGFMFTVPVSGIYPMKPKFIQK